MSSCDGGSVSSILPTQGMIGMGSMGGISYLECMHYERMPLPVPLPMVPPPMMLHSEDEVEPAYATGKWRPQRCVWRIFTFEKEFKNRSRTFTKCC